MKRYIVLFYGSYDESNWYEGHEANSKEELLVVLNARIQVVLDQNKLHEAYLDQYDDTNYTYDSWWEHAQNNPYVRTTINEHLLEESNVFEFPDEFWKHMTK